MHKLMEYICDELEELERKAEKEGKLSMAEIEYGDKLAHFKKNILSSEQLWEDSEYSMADGSYAGNSYTRGGNRSNSYARSGNRSSRRRGGANQYGSYAMGGYSREGADLADELRSMMQEAPDERTRMEFERFIKKIEQM